MDPWKGECNTQSSVMRQTRLFCFVVPSGANLGKVKKAKTEHMQPHYIDVQKASQAVSREGKQHRGTGQTFSLSTVTQGHP